MREVAQVAGYDAGFGKGDRGDVKDLTNEKSLGKYQSGAKGKRVLFYAS